MKKLLFILLLISSLFSKSLFGQCAPYDTNRPGIYPDTLINLVEATIGESYYDVITAVIPKDTLVFTKRIPFDSVVQDHLQQKNLLY